MTSRSLRKLQTTLWSTLIKTDFSFASGSLSQWLKGAGLAGLAALTFAASAGADETSGRASLDSAFPGKSTTTAQPKARNAAVARPPVRTATHSRVLPAAEMPAEDLFADFGVSSAAPMNTDVPEFSIPEASPATPDKTTQKSRPVQESASSPLRKPMSAPEIAAQARQQIAGESDRAYGRTTMPQDGFTSRMNQVLTGGMVRTSADSVGEWWQERSEQWVSPRAKSPAQQRPQSAGQKMSEATGRLMDRITLPEETEPDVDFYDAAPVAVSSASRTVVLAAGQETSDESVNATPASRLKTDIRSIKPSLSYALKNIDEEQLPEDFNARVDNGEYFPRQSSPTVYQWAPTNLYHFPLYFEDPSLERYGHTYHPLVQPFASTGRFATQLVGLPYQMTLHPVHSREYALGYYRPGECAPKKHYQIPFNEEATVVEVATIVGLFLIIP